MNRVSLREKSAVIRTMSDRSSASLRYKRLERDQELVRRAAQLFSNAVSLPELLAELAKLLTDVAEATSVVFTIDDAGGRRSETRFGSGGDPVAEVTVPVEFAGRLIGRLYVRPADGERFEREDVTALETLALQLGARLHADLQSEVDSLTTIANRRGFDEALAREWKRCARSGRPLAIALVDVDYFKRYNDAYGHVAGDACLQRVAGAIADCARRPGDVVARYGGEEFAVVMPECDDEAAGTVAETICERVRELAIAHRETSLGYVTVSIGTATAVPAEQGDPHDLLREADARLYDAKQSGRNRASGRAATSNAPVVYPHAATRHNLPHFVTPRIGREREIAEVAAMVRESRLASIVGTGGLGKTRLAVEAAATVLDDFAHGIWFVDLAPLSHASLLTTTIAGAIGLTLPPGDQTSTLLTLLRPHRLLIVLDNCEHVIDEAARLAELLTTACPSVRVLATSREPLDVAGEIVYRLAPLDEDSAVALFYERARRADRTFACDPASEPVVREICRRLDGIALAIELAAARVHALPPPQLLAALRERLAVLGFGKRTSLPRHTTMRALIDWSYDLLSESERTTFRRLSVFAGGFTLEGAANVASAAGAENLTGECVAALVDKSLVLAPLGGGVTFRLLDSMREYAAERLDQEGAADECRRQHAKYFADRSARMIGEYGRLPENDWLARYEPDLDNFRAAFDWSLKADCTQAAAIAGNMLDLWSVLGLQSEGDARCAAALHALSQQEADGTPALRILLTLARTAWEARDLQRCLEAVERALALAERLEDRDAVAEARYVRGRARFVSGADPTLGIEDLRRAVKLFEAIGNPARSARAMSSLGYALATSGGDLDEARTLQEQALQLAREAGFPNIAGAIEAMLAETEFASGDVARAIERGQLVVDAVRAGTSPSELIVSLGNLASYMATNGDYARARAAGREALAIASAYERTSRIPARIQAIALAEAGLGDVRLAAQLLGFVDACYAQRGIPRERTEAVVQKRLLEILEDRLHPQALEKESVAGAALSMSAACALALGEDIGQRASRHALVSNIR